MKKIILLLVFGFLAGCAAPPQKPIVMEKNYLQTGTKKVGVVLTEIPKPDVHLPGADCLLCMATAEMANSSLSDHVDKLIPDDFKLVESELIKQLKAKGINIVAIDDPIKLTELPEFESQKEGVAKYDYRGFRNKYGISHLLVITVNSIGMERKYSSYVPVDVPRAVVNGVSYLVDLSDNSYKWYKHVKINKSASGNWDEPPSYPALTNAFYQAIELGREDILAEF